ncbi:MAG: FAD-dependent oxidoreductase, partial [Acidimicrobiia bacterium]
MTDYRVAVLGLGGIGSAAAFWASRRLGGDVLGVEQFELGHTRGGSEDHSRIIRLSYHTPAYVELAKAAYVAWEQVEVDSGEQLVLRTGGLDLAPAGASIGLDDYRMSMTAASVPFDELDAAEVMRRWPQWRLSEDVTALYQERSGIAMASRSNETHRRLARENGATLVDGAGVGAVREVDGEVEIEVDGRTHRVGSLIVAAGAWTPTVLGGLGVDIPLEVTLEQVVYMEAADPVSFHPSRFPIWIWMDEPSFYGFPIFGEPAVKIAWDRCEIVTDPESRSFEPRDDVTEAVRGFAARHLPQAVGA